MGGGLPRPLPADALTRLWKFFYLPTGISDKNALPYRASFFNPLIQSHLAGLHKKLGKVGQTSVSPKVFL